MTDESDLAPEAAEFSSDHAGLREAAREQFADRPAPPTPEAPSLESQDVQPPIIEVGFLDQNGRVSEDAGPPSLTAHKAARLIGDWRDEQAQYLRAAAEQQANYQQPQVAQ